jgi:hypothetical protein
VGLGLGGGGEGEGGGQEEGSGEEAHGGTPLGLAKRWSGASRSVSSIRRASGCCSFPTRPQKRERVGYSARADESPGLWRRGHLLGDA